MRTRNIIDGLEILEKYRKSKEGHNVGAYYGILYAFVTDEPLSSEDLRKMIDLGWVQEQHGPNYFNAYSVEEYDQDEGWVAYVEHRTCRKRDNE